MNNTNWLKRSVCKNGATFIGSVLVVLSIWVLWMVSNFPDVDAGYRGISPSFFPYFLGFLVLFLSLALIWHGLGKEESPVWCFKLNCTGTYRMLLIFATVILFARGMIYSGFLPGSILFVFIVQYILGERKIGFMAVNSILVSLVMYAIFALLFRVPLPLPFWMN